MNETVMIIVPHPDDAEFAAGGTLALLARKGYRIIPVVATDGSAGTLGEGGHPLAERRKREGEEAARILGAQPPITLGYRDFTLDRLPPGELRERLVRLIRTHKPSVLFAQDPTATRDPHPDHRAVAEAASDAADFSNLPAIHPEHLAGGLRPHFVPEKYFFSDDPSRINRLEDISSVMDIKTAALLAHESQVEFLYQEIIEQAEAAGIQKSVIESLFGGDADPESSVGANPGTADHIPDLPSDHARRAIAWAARKTAEELGRVQGIPFAEGFRYVRFHPYIEALMKQQEDIQ